MATPIEPIPQLSYYRKFKIHVDSKELQAVGVSSLDFTSDSLKLGGKHCLVNGAVCPDFSQVPNRLVPVSHSSGGSRKRPHSADGPANLPQFGTSIIRRASVIKATGCSPSPSASGGTQHSVPGAAAVDPELQQVREDRPVALPDNPPNVTSQFNPEETPAEIPPARHSALGLRPALMDRLNRFPSISVTKAVPQVPSESPDPPPLQGLEKMNTIVNKWSHLWL